MSSSFELILANIFVNFQENFYFERFPELFSLEHYIIDTFAYFSSHNEVIIFPITK